MSFLDNINFSATVLTAGCISFAASNFGIKLGRLASFKNNSGYEYISNSKYKNALYQSIIDTDKPKFAQTAKQLEDWCKSNEKSIRKWKDASNYCLIKNNVRHQLLKEGYTIKNENTNVDNVKCIEVLDMHADDTKSSLGYLLGRSKCFNAPSENNVVSS